MVTVQLSFFWYLLGIPMSLSKYTSYFLISPLQMSTIFYSQLNLSLLYCDLVLGSKGNCTCLLFICQIVFFKIFIKLHISHINIPYYTSPSLQIQYSKKQSIDSFHFEDEIRYLQSFMHQSQSFCLAQQYSLLLLRSFLHQIIPLNTSLQPPSRILSLISQLCSLPALYQG